jgi:hypothetical protein
MCSRRGTRDEVWGERVFECRDPFGYVWEFSQPVPGTPPADWRPPSRRVGSATDVDEASRDVREVLPGPIPGVRARDPYFEVVPFDLVAAIVTQDGPRSSEHVRAALARWRVHPWLREG